MVEPAGFREFVASSSPALLRTAWMLTGNHAAAEDLLQTALTRAWPHWGRIRDGQPEAYLRTVMVRTNASWRSRRWNSETPTADPHASSGGRGGDSVTDVSASRIDELMTLREALASLPVRQRQAVVLRYFDDLAIETVAEMMKTTPGTVKSQSAKGLAKLRSALVATDVLETERP